MANWMILGPTWPRFTNFARSRKEVPRQLSRYQANGNVFDPLILKHHEELREDGDVAPSDRSGTATSTDLSTTRSAIRIPRLAPTAAKLVLPVWGYQYVRQFLEVGLPTLLSPGNVPAIARALPTEFILLTSVDDEPFIREHPALRQLAAICHAEIRSIDHLITDGSHSTTITLAYTEVVRAAGEAMLDTCFFFLVADYIMADGSLGNALKRMQCGASGVVVGNFQIAREDALPWFYDQLHLAEKNAIVLPPRELMQWALNHLHPATLANTVNVPFSHNSQTNRLFWRIDSNTMLGRFYLMHMLCVRPEVIDFVIGSSCDYSFVPEMCPSGNVEPITDSDEYLVVEIQPRDHEVGFLRPGPLKPRDLAKSLSEWTTSVHRANANYSLVFHAAPLPSQMALRTQEADAFISDIANNLSDEPLPFRGHPYWRGALAAFHDATGQRIEKDDWFYAFGLPVSGDRLTLWLLWRAKRALMGQSPYVLPWHPFWPDFSKVLEELKPFFSDRSLKLLMLSDKPTAFSVALADSGDRVRRLRSKPFLESPRERYEGLRRTFDICLLELTEGEMQNGDELVDRITPLMKGDARIIVFVTNRRSIYSIRDFCNGVTFHAPRFYRPGAIITDAYFVPANRLRWFVHRNLMRLRALTSRWRPAIVPAAVLGGLLLLLSFLGSYDVLRRKRQIGKRGSVSSLILRLSVDTTKATNRYTRSRVEMARGKLRRGRPWPKTSDIADPLADPHKRIRREQTPEAQHAGRLENANKVAQSSVRSVTNQIWRDDPYRPTLLLARYKFISKMLSGRSSVAEVGCGDWFGIRLILEDVPDVSVYDFDPAFIADFRTRQYENDAVKAEVHDIIDGPLPHKYDGVFSLDLIEHISPEDEHAFLANLRGSLASDGVLIIGTPWTEPHALAFPPTPYPPAVNCKNGEQLKVLVNRYFAQTFLFSMNDEIVHAGLHPMARYLFAVCTGPK
jgi:hypothetical protein